MRPPFWPAPICLPDPVFRIRPCAAAFWFDLQHGHGGGIAHAGGIKSNSAISAPTGVDVTAASVALHSGQGLARHSLSAVRPRVCANDAAAGADRKGAKDGTGKSADVKPVPAPSKGATLKHSGRVSGEVE